MLSSSLSSFRFKLLFDQGKTLKLFILQYIKIKTKTNFTIYIGIIRLPIMKNFLNELELE